MAISVGIVGCGSFAEGFIGLFKAHPRVTRLALCDILPDRLAEVARQFEVTETYTSLDAVCRSNLDAVVIMTQPWLHAPQAIQVMESGKHVYSAVPVISLPDGAQMLDWCGQIIDACRRTGQHYMLGETTVYRAEAMYCRRRAVEGAFGPFVHAEGEYFHPFDGKWDLREVKTRRLTGRAAEEIRVIEADALARGVRGGPMHYPTHSVSGPIHVMKARAIKVSAWGYRPRSGDSYFADSPFSNETALFRMSNDATMRICEYREIGFTDRETFRLYGTEGTYEHNRWFDKRTETPLTPEQMRDALPADVEDAFRNRRPKAESVYGGHGGSHAFLVHEFVEAIDTGRRPSIDAWEAARYMAAGVTAHQSALRDGELLDVPDFGESPS